MRQPNKARYDTVMIVCVSLCIFFKCNFAVVCCLLQLVIFSGVLKLPICIGVLHFSYMRTNFCNEEFSSAIHSKENTLHPDLAKRVLDMIKFLLIIFTL